MTKYLIVNADDFGICRATNEAIEELSQKGRITSVSLMVPGKAAEDAIGRLQHMPDISIGLHVTLTSDFKHEMRKAYANDIVNRPVLDVDGLLYEKKADFDYHATSEWIISEMAAQYFQGERLGVAFDHLDSHDGVLEQHGLRAAFHFCASHQLGLRFAKGPKMLHDKEADFAEMKKVGVVDMIITNPFSIQDILAYATLKQFYLDALKEIPEGVTELFLHPSKESSEYYEETPEWQKRVWEYEFLMDDDFLKTIEREGITLVSWSFLNERV